MYGMPRTVADNGSCLLPDPIWQKCVPVKRPWLANRTMSAGTTRGDKAFVATWEGASDSSFDNPSENVALMDAEDNTAPAWEA